MYDYCRGCTSFKNLKCTTSYGNRDCSLKATCKKLEKVGEPFKELNHSTNKYVFLQEYKLFDPHAFLVDKVYAEHCFGLYGRNSFFIEIN